MCSRTFKKIAASVLAILLVLSAFSFGSTTLAAGNFSDISNSYAQQEIEALVEAGIISGFDDGTFRPKESMTRAQLAKVLVLSLGLEEDPVAASIFTDVATTSWYSGYIGALYNSGITKGTTETTFSPHANVTREELAVFFVRAFNLEEAAKKVDVAASLTDSNQVSAWAKQHVSLAFRIGFINGIKNQDESYRFEPNAYADRQALARLAYEFHVNKDKYVTAAQKLIVSVPDILVATGTVASFSFNGKMLRFDDGKVYTISNELQMTLLHTSNAVALKKAQLTFEVSSNNQLIKITHLELNQDGQPATVGKDEYSGNVIFNGREGVVHGSVVVKGDYVTLQNLTINQNLTVDELVKNDFKSVNVTVAGTTYVNGGSADTVEFENTQIETLEVNKEEVKIKATSDTSIGQASVNADHTKFEADDKSKVSKVTINSTGTTISGNGKISEIVVEKKDATVTLNLTTKIDKVTVNQVGTTLKGSTQVGELKVEAKGTTKVELTKKPETTTKNPDAIVTEPAPPSPTPEPAPPAFAVSSITASNLEINVGVSSTYTVNVGSAANDAIGNITISFNRNIKKADKDDIELRVFNGGSPINLSVVDKDAIKGLLFRFSSGTANQLSGSIVADYSTLKTAMDLYAGSGNSVTKLEVDVFDLNNNKLTITLNIN